MDVSSNQKSVGISVVLPLIKAAHTSTKVISHCHRLGFYKLYQFEQMPRSRILQFPGSSHSTSLLEEGQRIPVKVISMCINMRQADGSSRRPSNAAATHGRRTPSFRKRTTGYRLRERTHPLLRGPAGEGVVL